MDKKAFKVNDNVYDKLNKINGVIAEMKDDTIFVISGNNAYKTKIEHLESKFDNINHPHRYTKGKVECIDAIESATIDLKGVESFCTGNVIKYVWRWKEKEQIDSLKKAKWYLEHLIKYLEGKQ